jgi:glycosyltransferase involved in cell wall biosynthesis
MNQKIKVLLVADTYYPKVDGTLIFMKEFIKRANQDFEISLLVPNLGKKVGKNVTYLDVYKRISVSGYPSIKFSFKNIKKIKQAVKETDVVFVQGPALASYLSMYYGNKYNKKTFFYTHTIAWEVFEKFFPPLLNKLFFNLIKRSSFMLYNRCNKILVPYNELKKHLRQEGVKSDISIARLGVDIEKFVPISDEDKEKLKIKNKLKDKKVIGYVGRVSKEKNVDVLLDAFKKLENQEDLFLLIVGDGTKEQIEKFKQIKNCKITGFVDDVDKYLKLMDVFVMPSLTETTSLATLEAMATGLPVIVTKVGFMRKYIVKNHNGVFFPRNSPTMLAAKIEKMLNDNKFSKKLSKNARKTVAYSFSWERSINKIKRLLQDK